MKRAFIGLVLLGIALAAGGGAYERIESRRARDAAQTLSRQIAADRRSSQRLRGQIAAAVAAAAEKANQPVAFPSSGDAVADSRLLENLARISAFKRWLSSHPDEQIPEFRFLSDREWFAALESTSGAGDLVFAAAARSLRDTAKNEFLPFLVAALRSFARAEGRMPADLGELKPYFIVAVDDSLLGRYELTGRAALADLERPAGDRTIMSRLPIAGASSNPVVRERVDGRPLDLVYIDGLPLETASPLPQPSDFPAGSVEAGFAEIMNAMAQYTREHDGRDPEDAAALRPYVKDPAILEGFKFSTDGRGGGSVSRER